ncbi:hypothetical protein E2562_011397 [Oryza meyeriana var. granulata]|uniref:Uncharacterized protein n=1 Tax=Oryza meyeriana var. granulata TaxID=110450 RepID=A0A6G1EA49_9ORYZ|nr:hypothetical protein E2562_011397 [Oryza meyeriana var. granulata]
MPLDPPAPPSPASPATPSSSEPASSEAAGSPPCSGRCPPEDELSVNDNARFRNILALLSLAAPPLPLPRTSTEESWISDFVPYFGKP